MQQPSGPLGSHSPGRGPPQWGRQSHPGHFFGCCKHTVWTVIFHFLLGDSVAVTFLWKQCNHFNKRSLAGFVSGPVSILAGVVAPKNTLEGWRPLSWTPPTSGVRPGVQGWQETGLPWGLRVRVHACVCMHPSLPLMQNRTLQGPGSSCIWNALGPA